MLEQRINKLKTAIGQLAAASGRAANPPLLLAVSKKKSLADIYKAQSCGIKDFAENRVQEMQEKLRATEQSGIRWHFIGHLQRNKLKYFKDRITLFHALDSLSLAQKISEKYNDQAPLNCLIEIKISREPNKYGLDSKYLGEFLDKVDELSGISIKGLMTMAPYSDNAEDSRPYFQKLRQLRDQFRDRAYRRIELKELSMGMSGDYPVAIEEGATIVRIGTALFGPR